MRLMVLSLLWTLSRVIFAVRYKVVARGVRNIPDQGPVLLLGNHVSWIDWLLVQFPLKRRLRYMMDKTIYEWRSLHWMFRLGRAIPVSQRAVKGALAEAGKVLREGEALVIFPEGAISRSCGIEEFYRGFEIIAAEVEDGVIIPFFIDGMCGSRWSRTSKRYTPKRAGFRRVVTIVYGAAMPINSPAETVREAVVKLKESCA